MFKGYIVVLLSVISTAAWATDYSWISNSGTNSFQADSNWSPTGVPGSADTTQFTTAGSYGISFAADATNINAEVGADLTFNLSGHKWCLTDGLFLTGTATASFGGGSFVSDHTDSLTVRSGQKLILNSGSTYFRHPISTSSGTLEVHGGDHILNMGLSPSTAPADDVSIRMTGGTLSLTNSDNGARFVLNGNSKTSLEGGMISVRQVMDTYGWANSPSEINIYTNASLYFPSTGINFSRGGGGLSTMNILGGSVALSNGTFSVANTAGNRHLSATGIVSIVDGLLHARNLYLAEKSNSVAIVNQSAGELRVTDSLRIGRAKDTLGVYTQSDGEAYCHNVYVGANTPDAHGEMHITGGKFWADSIYAGGYGDGTTGEITLSGGELVTPNQLLIGNADGGYGSLIQSGGSLIVSNRINIGSYAGGSGRLVIDGSPLFVRDGIYIGTAAGSTGELVIAEGSYVQPNGMTIGTLADSVAKLHIDGGDLVLSNTLNIGSATGVRGEVKLTEGHLLSVGSTMGILVGNKTGAEATLTIDGGTLIATNKYALFAGASQGSRGEITINDGIVDIRSMRIGHMNDCYGSLRITGGHTYMTNDVNFNCVFGNVLVDQACPTGRLEMAGGVFETRQVNGGGGYATALFDGGTLKCAKNSNTYLISNFDQATLTDNGAVIDSNGRTTTIAQVLENEAGYAGSFTKTGAGKVILSRANTFTGSVTVTEGELEVTSGLYLTGGMVIDAGALLNLSAATLIDSTTAPWSTSLIDGTLTLPSGAVLTNGTGAVFGGSGVVNGSLLFSSGSIWAQDKTDTTGALQVTGSTVFEAGTTIDLTGYTEAELQAGIPLISTTGSGTIQTTGRIPVTMDGASDDTWWTSLSPDAKNLTARKLFPGTVIIVR